MDAKEKIRMAALTEFAEKGYTKASTNSIAQKSGQAKGLIFHYYQSKKNLYLEVVQYTIKIFVDYYGQAVHPLPEDFFDRMMKATKVKMEIYKKEPLIHKILFDAYSISVKENMPEIMNLIRKGSQKEMDMFLSGYDTSKFRGAISAEQTVDYIMTIFEALSERYRAKYHYDYDKITATMDDFIKETEMIVDLIKYGVYIG